MKLCLMLTTSQFLKSFYSERTGLVFSEFFSIIEQGKNQTRIIEKDISKTNKRIAILIISTITLFLVINLFSDNVLAGEIFKVIAPNSYKKGQKDSRIYWFDKLAKDEGLPIHVASGWSYLSEEQYEGMLFLYK